MSISENLNRVQSTLPANVKLVAVSKTKPNETIMKAYRQGQRLFGENKVQDLVAKSETLPKDIQWHFIGHLQTNKVKYIAPFISLIHAVDSMKLLKTINAEGAKHERVIDCLVQFHIAREESKFGLSFDDAKEFFTSPEFTEMHNTRIVGVMGMATYTNKIEQIRSEFKTLKNIFQNLKKDYFFEDQSFSEISMGMSDDYLVAVEQGSTMVRIGSTIFGERVYQ